MIECQNLTHQYIFVFQYLTTIAVQLLKLGGTNEVTLTSHGLCWSVLAHIHIHIHPHIVIAACIIYLPA